jgi:cytochrome c biogenesis protein CcmG/thiol:disulfide interchange protein DsbE
MSRARTSSSDAGGARAASRSGRRRTAAVAAALAVATVVAVLVGSGSGGGGRADSEVAFDPDTRSLSFRLERFDGGTADSADLRGTPVVLNFYASWCTVCDRELPDFQRVAEQLDGRVHVLGVNPQSNDTDPAQAAMIRRAGVTYPTLRDPQDELLRAFNTTGGLPTTVFIDADGIVRKVHNGLLTEPLLLDEIATSLGVRG